jgi:hypothetical protein
MKQFSIDLVGSESGYRPGDALAGDNKGPMAGVPSSFGRRVWPFLVTSKRVAGSHPPPQPAQNSQPGFSS